MFNLQLLSCALPKEYIYIFLSALSHKDMAIMDFHEYTSNIFCQNMLQGNIRLCVFFCSFLFMLFLLYVVGSVVYQVNCASSD